MFDKETEQALSKLDDESLLKVSKMIQKLADKKKQHKNNKKEPPKNNRSEFLHEIGSSSAPTKTEPLSVTGDRLNLFDGMPEKNEHQTDVEIDKKLAVHSPSERSRGSNLIEVSCCSCNKKAEISSSLVPQETDRYICNSCQVRGIKK